MKAGISATACLLSPSVLGCVASDQSCYAATLDVSLKRCPTQASYQRPGQPFTAASAHTIIITNVCIDVDKCLHQSSHSSRIKPLPNLSLVCLSFAYFNNRCQSLRSSLSYFEAIRGWRFLEDRAALTASRKLHPMTLHSHHNHG